MSRGFDGSSIALSFMYSVKGRAESGQAVRSRVEIKIKTVLWLSADAPAAWFGCVHRIEYACAMWDARILFILLNLIGLLLSRRETGREGAPAPA